MLCACLEWTCRSCHTLIPRDRPEWPPVPPIQEEP